MNDTRVKDLMEKNLTMIDPDDSLCEASRKMKEAGCGCLVVGTNGLPQGVITDRDIVTRAIACGYDPADEKVRNHMTDVVRSCSPDNSLTEAAEKMRQHGVGRLIVKDDNNKICGILSLGKILRKNSDIEEITKVVTCATGRNQDYARQPA